MEVSGWLLVALGGIVLLNTVFVVLLAVALWRLNVRIQELLDRSGPLIERATVTLAEVDRTAGQASDRLERILGKSEEVVTLVGRRVDAATHAAEEVITEPLIQAAGVVAGIRSGLEAYARGPEQAHGDPAGPAGRSTGNGTHA